MSKEITFIVEGMHCNSCGLLVDDEVEELAGVEESKTDVSAGRTVVTYKGELSPEDVVQAIQRAGYEGTLLADD